MVTDPTPRGNVYPSSLGELAGFSPDDKSKGKVCEWPMSTPLTLGPVCGPSPHRGIRVSVPGEWGVLRVNVRPSREEGRPGVKVVSESYWIQRHLTWGALRNVDFSRFDVADFAVGRGSCRRAVYGEEFREARSPKHLFTLPSVRRAVAVHVWPLSHWFAPP